jgi:hypothetical protein
MKRLALALILLLAACSQPAYAQLVGGVQPNRVAASALNAVTCNGNVPSTYLVVDPVDADSCTTGTGVVGDDINVCVCQPGHSGGPRWVSVASTFGVKADAVSTGNIVDGEVRTADIGDSQVTTLKILDRTIQAGDIAVGAIGAAEITDGGVTLPDLAATNSSSAGQCLTVSASNTITYAACGNATAETIVTVETDTSLVLKPDGAGGAEWGTDEGGASNFDELGTGTNTSSNLFVGSGASLTPTGTGVIAATDLTPDAIDSTTDLAAGLCTDGQALVKAGGAWTCGAASGAANLGTTVAADQVTVTNDAGTPAVIPAATTTTAGALTGADKTKLDGVEAGAAADQTDAEILSAWESETGRTASADAAKLDGIEAGAAADQAAAEVPFVNTITGFVATQIQAAIDELYTWVIAQLALARDPDGDGLYESSYLADWDGDGSGWVTCSAKDTPDPGCKFDGHRVYRDTFDDLVCGIIGCGFGQMELDGLILLEEGTYLGFPCFDAGEPSGFNDPTAANDDLRDAIADTAYQHCPAAPDSSRRIFTLATMGWQGRIRGTGRDLRDPSDPGWRPDRGTYLLNDMGPSWEVEGRNVWFGQDGFVRGIGIGFAPSINTNAAAPSQSGENVTDGDSKGYGVISGDQLSTDLDSDGQGATICVADTSAGGTVSADGWAQTLDAGDIVIVRGSSHAGASGFEQARVNFAMRVRDTPTATTCNGAGTVAIPIGGRDTSGTDGEDFGTIPPFVRVLYDGAYVMAARSEALQAGATFENMTIGPLDWWGEPGGDCGESGVWSQAADQAGTDFDCDTNPLVGFWGGTRGGLVDVVIQNHHDRSVDGATHWGQKEIRRVDWINGRGGPIADPAYGFNFYESTVWNTQFAAGALDTFGPGIEIDGLRFINTTASYYVSVGIGSRFNTIKGLRVLGSAFGHIIQGTCGADFNHFEDIVVSGRYGTGGNGEPGVIARWICSDPTTPITTNTISGVRMDGPMQLAPLNETNCAVVLETGSGGGTDNTDAIIGNSFDRFRWVTTSQTKGQFGLFCNRHNDTTYGAGAVEDQNVLWKNSFTNSFIRYDGATGAGPRRANVYNVCLSNDTCATDVLSDADSSVTHNPMGCGNLEAGGVAGVFSVDRPAIQDCI